MMTTGPTTALPARAGLGFKPEHAADAFASGDTVGFFEVHAENYMQDGGPALRLLDRVAERWPLSLHGVALSIGGAVRLDRDHLGRLKRLIARTRPASFSEHLAWSTHDGTFLNDLLPLPYTQATLRQVCDHVDEAQEALSLRLLLENPSTYLTFAESTVEETAFLGEIARRTGCGLLLDVNNVMVSAVNQGVDPYDWIDRFPVAHVGEIHLAGYDETQDGAGDRLLIDAHGSAVKGDVWDLYAHALARTGPVPTLVEWDNDVPSFAVLAAEGRRVDRMLADVPAARRRA